MSRKILFSTVLFFCRQAGTLSPSSFFTLLLFQGANWAVKLTQVVKLK